MNAFCASVNFDAFTVLHSSQPGKSRQKTLTQIDPVFREQSKTINGLYKTEVIHRRGPWRSFEAVEFATLEWVDWFNNRRLLAPIGYIPPARAEERYYASLDQPAMAA
jgi:transposase InsO family protein